MLPRGNIYDRLNYRMIFYNRVAREQPGSSKMAVIAGRMNIRYEDYDGEVSTVRVGVEELTALNFDAQVALGVTFMDTIAGITLGLKTGFQHMNDTKTVLGPSSDVDAQRERKWLVQWHDGITFKRYTTEIPCADLAQLDPNDRGNANIGDAGVVDAFVAAWEAYVITPDGNTAIVDEISHVGRNV